MRRTLVGKEAYMRVLVAYGSKHGGTRGLAEWLGSSLEDLGHDVTVAAITDVDDVDRYEAVVVGGALYMMRWHADARRFVKRHMRELQDRPVWFFSSGPLDETATEEIIPAVRFVRRAMEQVGARGHMTFGGRLEPGVANAKLPTGDWRDRQQVTGWAEEIAEQLESLTVGS